MRFPLSSRRSPTVGFSWSARAIPRHMQLSRHDAPSWAECSRTSRATPLHGTFTPRVQLGWLSNSWSARAFPCHGASSWWDVPGRSAHVNCTAPSPLAFNSVGRSWLACAFSSARRLLRVGCSWSARATSTAQHFHSARAFSSVGRLFLAGACNFHCAAPSLLALSSVGCSWSARAFSS